VSRGRGGRLTLRKMLEVRDVLVVQKRLNSLTQMASFSIFAACRRDIPRQQQPKPVTAGLARMRVDVLPFQLLPASGHHCKRGRLSEYPRFFELGGNLLLKYVFGSEKRGAFDHILQLSHINPPAVVHEAELGAREIPLIFFAAFHVNLVRKVVESSGMSSCGPGGEEG